MLGRVAGVPVLPTTDCQAIQLLTTIDTRSTHTPSLAFTGIVDLLDPTIPAFLGCVVHGCWVVLCMVVGLCCAWLLCCVVHGCWVGLCMVVVLCCAWLLCCVVHGCCCAWA